MEWTPSNPLRRHNINCRAARLVAVRPDRYDRRPEMRCRELVEDMRATIPKPVIVIIAMLLVVPASVGATGSVSNGKTHVPVADGIRISTVMVVDDDGKILATGDEALLARLPDAVRIDGRTKFVLPGQIDAHAHVLAFGISKTRVDYFDVPVDQIDDIRVLETWIGGKRVYTYTRPAEAAKQ